MKREMILVLLMGLFLLLLFLVTIASDAVAATILPVISREREVIQYHRSQSKTA